MFSRSLSVTRILPERSTRKPLFVYTLNFYTAILFAALCISLATPADRCGENFCFVQFGRWQTFRQVPVRFF